MATKEARQSYAGTNVDLGLGPGYDRVQKTERVSPRSLDGTLYDYSFYTSKLKEIIPIIDMIKTDADNINTWWENLRECTWYPNYTDHSGTSYSVKIMNDEQPLWFRYLAHLEAHYSGTLILEET